MGVGQTELWLVQVTSMTSIATNFSRSPDYMDILRNKLLGV